jgi:uncharacterized surface protein with fasciclin (FAS1) repeats
MKRCIIFLLTGCLLLLACSSQMPDDLPEVILATPVRGQSGVSSGGDTAVSPSTNTSATILDVLADNGEFALFLNMLNNAGLSDELVSGENMTIFAPTNLVFSHVGLSSQLDANDVWLIMRHHIVDDVLTTDDLRSRSTLTSNEGSPISLTTEGDQLMLDYAHVIEGDMVASNGIIHMVDALLLPPEQEEMKSMWGTLVADGRFSQLTHYAGGLPIMYAMRFGSNMNGFITPTDAAFAQLPQEFLTAFLDEDPENVEYLFAYYTIAPDGWSDDEPLTAAALLELGQAQTAVRGTNSRFQLLPVTGENDVIQIDGAAVLEDIGTKTGVIYVIDTVLLPDDLAQQLD